MDEYLMTGSISPSSPRTSKKLAKTLTVRRISSVRFAENKEEEAMTSIVPDINPMEVQQPLVPPLLYGAEYMEMAQNQPGTPFRFSAALDDQKLQQFVEGFDVVHQHLVQRKSASSHLSGDEIYFDHSSHSAVNNKMCLVSSEGLDCGVHEWVIKILNSDIFLQEIGVIGVCELDDIAIHKDGLKATHQCAARAMFGSELGSDSMFCGSYDRKRGRQRCFKDVSNERNIGWVIDDEIGVHLNLKKNFIRYTLNGQMVSKKMSVQSKQTYYPIICFEGHCQYELL